ncbi:MAG: SIMPL domain-containing protein, partial [Christensenellales bacterium]
MADRVLTVRGTGNVSVKPDLIIIGMTLAAQHRDYAKTMENAASEIESLRAALLSVGFEKDSLKTIDFNVDTAYESEKDAKGNWKRRFDGYRCIHKLKLEFDLDMERLNDTLTAISSSKAVPEFQINFSIKNQSAVSEQLLREAIRNASEKAAILASAAGVSLGKIQRIDYDWSE